MTKIWSVMLILSIVIALLTGNVQLVISSIMDSGKSAVENVIGLVGMMCFWSGIFHILEETKAIQRFAAMFSKLLGKLFNKKEISTSAMQYMSLNICSNVIGVGNASTVNGIKAMEEMQKQNPDKNTPSDNMATFILINTASLQLIPTSMIALRTMYQSSAPSSIIVPVWIVTCVSLIFGILSIKILNKRMK